MNKNAETVGDVHTYTHYVSLLQKKKSALTINGKNNFIKPLIRKINKVIAAMSIACIIMPNCSILGYSLKSFAVSNSEDIAIVQQITKYIPYNNSEEDIGVILQQKIKVEIPEVELGGEIEIKIKTPTYAELLPENIEIYTENGPVSNSEEESEFYTLDTENNFTIINIKTLEKQIIEKEYYINYYYSQEAYNKYLDTTHVKEYPEGKIVSIEKDQETGETWAYIDFAWDPEENEGEMPENKHLVDKLPINLETTVTVTEDKNKIEAVNVWAEELDIQINEVIHNELSLNIPEISKGSIYAKKDISYETTDKINILRSDIVNKIEIKDLEQSFINANNETQIISIIYQSTTISKQNFEAILGQEGYIKLIDENGEEIATINSDMQEDTNGNYKVDYTTPISKVNIETSDIINDGFLIIKHNKVIDKDKMYPKTQVETFSAFTTSNYINATNTYGSTYTKENSTEIPLIDSETIATFSISNDTLSTADINTGIEFRVELNNNNINSDLWTNPFIILEMPEEISEIKINNVNILYGDALQILQKRIIELNGHQAMLIKLEGAQQDFISSSIIGGTTIVINTDIKLDELTPTKENNEIKLYYFNENKTNYENETTIELEDVYSVGTNKVAVNYIAPVGFQTIQTITGFDDAGTIISSTNESQKEGKIEILAQSREITNNVTIMNNTGNQTTNIKVLGRIAYAGNKNVLTGEDLGSTITTNLTSQIQLLEQEQKEFTIYYTENEEADTNLENSQNGWAKEIQNIEAIKSYMIIINNVAQGEKIVFEYKTKIPEMLQHGEYAYSNIVTYYTNNTEVGNVEAISEANKIGITTGIGARASIEISAGIDEGANLTEGQKITYKIKLQNTGELVAENVVVRNPIPYGASYIQETRVDNEIETYDKYTYYSSSNELKWEIGKLEPNQTIELQYNVVVDNIPTILEYYGAQEGFTEEDGKFYIISTGGETGEKIRTEITELPTIIIENYAVLEASNIEKEIQSNTTHNQVIKSYFNIFEESSKAKSVYLEEGESYKYTVIVENKIELQMKNINISKVIPDGISYTSATILQGSGEIKFDQANNKLTAICPELGAYDTIELEIEVTANKLQGDVYKKEIVTNTAISAEGVESNTSSSVTNTIAKPKISAKLESDTKQRYVYEKDIITYNINITNENDATISNLCINNIIPEGTKFISGTYTKLGQEYQILSDGSEEIKVETNLGQGTITVQIKVQVENIDSDVEELDIVNKATLSANNVEEFEIGQIKHTVINTNSGNGGTDGDSSEGSGSGNSTGEVGEDGKIRYKIKGTAWEDINKDGERQESEEFLKGITVYLINENGNIVKDYKTGEEKKTTTDLDGDYEFKNIEPGKYMVVFMYDSTQYDITEYQKNNVINDRNSDAILKKINLGGQEREAGVTDLIEITNRTILSIDIGMYKKPKFNLKLEAGITNITVKTSKGTTQTTYDMSSLAKTEIKSKEINGATVLIEYTLKVTNNGDIAGSVTQIMADKPNGLIFTSDMNEQWYEGNDKKIYLTGISDEILNPGESTNIKLILTKQMTGNNVGKIENTFSITKTYNEKGLEDSKAEDNTSSVICLLTVSTGMAPVYTGTGIIILTIIGTGVYIIRKKLATEKRWI